MTFLPFRPVWGVFWLESVIINCLRPEMGSFWPERLWHAPAPDPEVPKSNGDFPKKALGGAIVVQLQALNADSQ